MGTSLTKCCINRGEGIAEKNERKRKKPGAGRELGTKGTANAHPRQQEKNGAGEQKGRGQHTQHAAGESTVNDAINRGATIEDSSNGGGKTTRSKQKKINEDGSVTYITNKTTIDSSISFKAGNNINIYDNRNTYNNKTVQSKPGKSTDKPFQSYYSDSRAKEEGKQQYESEFGPLRGNFIDTRDIHTKEYVFESSAKVDAAQLVCMICFPGGTGTGFRVGAKYIMTAKHVVDSILNQGYQPIGPAAQLDYSRLQSSNVFAEFGFKIEGQQIPDRQKYF